MLLHQGSHLASSNGDLISRVRSIHGLISLLHLGEVAASCNGPLARFPTSLPGCAQHLASALPLSLCCLATLAQVQ